MKNSPKLSFLCFIWKPSTRGMFKHVISEDISDWQDSAGNWKLLVLLIYSKDDVAAIPRNCVYIHTQIRTWITYSMISCVYVVRHLVHMPINPVNIVDASLNDNRPSLVRHLEITWLSYSRWPPSIDIFPSRFCRVVSSRSHANTDGTKRSQNASQQQLLSW